MIINKGKNVFPLTTLQAFIDTISMMLGIAIYGQILGGFKEIHQDNTELTLIFSSMA